MINRLFLTVLVLLAAHPAYAEKSVPQSQAQVQLSFAPVVKNVSPAVVNIYTKRTVARQAYNPFMSDPFFSHFFGGRGFGQNLRPRVERALGSGVIVAEDGQVVTNAHVIKGAEEITVVLQDGREFPAELMLRDEASDLALLKIEDHDETFPAVTLKPSETLEVGDIVLAIGNPFGVGQTVTSGIVSAQGRSSLDVNDFNFFIQTDAAINPGNSGGALVALDGGVVGINTAIYSRDGGSLGIGFAVPSEMVASVLAAAQSGQSGENGIIRPWLGLTAQNVTADIAKSLGLKKPQGVLVGKLHKASPLREAGVKVGDVITKISVYDIDNAAEMKFRMATVPLGEYADIEILRKGDVTRLQVQAIAPPNVPPRDELTLDGRHILSGVTFANINPAVEIELGLEIDEDQKGVVAMDVPRGAYIGRVLGRGDILQKINDREIEDMNDLKKAIKKLDKKSGIQMTVNSGGRVQQIILR